MRILYILLLLMCLLCPPLRGQSAEALTQHQLSLDLGGTLNRYLYPITDLRYQSPLLNRLPLRFSGRLRAYGTWFLYSRSAYDLTPLAEYYFTRNGKPLYFSAGIGMDARLRLVNDERSTARSSAEPLLSLAAHGHIQRFAFTLPLWTRFYTNGISCTLLPEATWYLRPRIPLLLRYEIGYQQLYRYPEHEWRQGAYLGVGVLF